MDMIIKKYKVDLTKTSNFKGIIILFDYLEEGLDYAQQNNIKDVCIRTDINDNQKKTVNFEFLKGRDFIEIFHWLVPLSKKSNMGGVLFIQLKEFTLDSILKFFYF
ncbi:hypothetical protein ACYSNM_11455 [Myroides sp. LJL116]